MKLIVLLGLSFLFSQAFAAPSEDWQNSRCRWQSSLDPDIYGDSTFYTDGTYETGEEDCKTAQRRSILASLISDEHPDRTAVQGRGFVEYYDYKHPEMLKRCGYFVPKGFPVSRPLSDYVMHSSTFSNSPADLKRLDDLEEELRNVVIISCFDS